MAEQTYLYSYGNGPHGASPTRRTRGYIEAQGQFSKVHPELMDRLFRLCDAVIAAGGDYGFGGGWRSSLQQRNLFLSRYTRIQTTQAPNPGRGLWWDGSPSWPQDAGWYVHTSGAPSAPPGRSYHESTTNGGLGFALAVDMVGTHAIGNRLASAFGLNSFEDVNAEPWHYQPIEIPNARRNYGGQFENPTPWFPPDQEAPTMQALAAPVRLIDTRPLPTVVAPEQRLEIPVAAGRPDWARSAVVNITVTLCAGPGYVTAWGGGDRPNASNLNYTTGQTVANLAVVPLNADGEITVSPAVAGCHVVVDQQGWAA